MLAAQLIKEISGLVKVFGKDKGVKVIFEGEKAFTDGEKVVLPEIPLSNYLTQKKVAAIRGLVDHECGHIRHTDLESMTVAHKKINSEYISFLLNVVEDCRIDRKVSNEMPGAAINLNQLTENASDEIFSELKKVDDGSKKTFKLDSLPHWMQDEKFWGPLSIFLLDAKKRGNYFESLDSLLNFVPENTLNKAELIVEEIFQAENSYDSLNIATHAAHIFGFTPEKLSQAEKDLLEKIVEFLSKMLTDEMAKKILEEKNTEKLSVRKKVGENNEYGNPDKGEVPFRSLPDINSVKYKILTTEYDYVGPSKATSNKNISSKLKPAIVRALQEMLQTECRGYRGLGEIGKRLDPKSLVKAYQAEPRVFLERTSDKDIDTAIGILVDASGSMCGEPMQVAGQSSFEIASALESFPVVSEVAFFTTGYNSRSTYKEGYRSEPTRLEIVKSWNQSVRERKKYFSGMCEFCGCNNADGESLLDFANRISIRPEQKKIMIVLSDGLPACGVGYPAEEEFLKIAIHNISLRNIDLAGIGILSNHVKEYYPTYSVIEDINQLPNSLQELTHKLIKDSIKRG